MDTASMIIIHQMSKVASTSIKKSLEEYINQTKIFHTHMLTSDTWNAYAAFLSSHRNRSINNKNLNGIEINSSDFSIKNKSNFKNRMKQKIVINLKNRSFREQIKEGKKIRKRIEDIKNNGKNEKIKIITIAREPIAQSISAFFQTGQRVFFDDFYEKSVSTLIDFFLTQANNFDYSFNPKAGTVEDNLSYFYHRPIKFFDIEIKPVYDIDVYKSNFPKKKGYKIYKNDISELLVLKFENINKCIGSAIREFMGIDEFHLLKENIGNKKPYRNKYLEFRRNIKFPENFIEKYYSTEYMKTFYTDEEIKDFKRKWSS